MKDASRTWALVVGIDEYDDPSIPRLTGAARDAVAAVTWLRALGVPDHQILLAATPCADAQAAVDALGLPYTGCTEPEIWNAVTRLRRQSGERLFLFLSGHGLFEPTTERLFLTQEASEHGGMVNLGITKYARLLRSMDFRRQFLFMDGCQNYPYSPTVRAQVEAAMHPGIPVPPPRADTTVVTCFAASQGEQALEVDDRGLLLAELLRAVDPLQPHPRCLSVDDADGSLWIGLEAALDVIVGPNVTNVAGQKGWAQHPAKQVSGRGEALPTVPFVAIAPTTTARLEVSVDPADAVASVSQIRIRTEEDVLYDRVVPTPPASSVVVPVRGVFPAGIALSVRCRLGPGAAPGGAPTQLRELRLEGDERVVFPVLRPTTTAPRTGEVVITSVGPDGRPVDALTDRIYDEIQGVLSATRGITMTRREIGPVLSATRASDADLLLASRRLARELTSHTPEGVQVALEAADSLPTRGTLRVLLPRGGASRLAGALADAPLLEVAGARHTLGSIATHPDVPVDADAVDVTVSLPWGRWSRRERVEAGGVSTVRLPTSVGLPPLRVRVLTDERVLAAGGRTLVVTGRVPSRPPTTWPGVVPGAPVPLPPGVAQRGAAGVFTWPEEIAPRPTDTTATGTTETGTTETGTTTTGTTTTGTTTVTDATAARWAPLASIRGRFRFVLPLHPERPVLVALGSHPRAEPFSPLAYPEWDLLVSSGRLDALTAEQAEELSWGKWEDPMLGVAAAYALLARGSEDFLRTVLGNLMTLDPTIPDVAVLRATLDPESGPGDAKVEDLLAAHARARAVPVLRWGVPLAMMAARARGFDAWLARLGEVDRGLVPTSVWTMWRSAGSRRAGRAP